jgi:hypothetical protein
MIMDTKQLIAALEMWAPMVASGYEVPAAGQVMMEAARRLSGVDKALDRINEGLQTGETRDALVEAKYLIIDSR